MVKPKRHKQPWIDDELKFLISKQKATEKRYLRTKNSKLLNELIQLAEQIETLSATARNTFINGRLDDAITSGQNFWKELKHLGLLPNPKSELHGFSPDDLNIHFSKVCFSEYENSQEISEIIMPASENGFKFHEVTLNDVILAIKHFKSQATGNDGIPQSIIAKSVPAIGPFLVQLFNKSLNTGTRNKNS